jgi:predicted oxidoreductase
MKTKQLGNSDLFITPVGFGAWAIGGSGWEFGWGEQDDKASVAAIHRALDLGVNWIDTAAVYGMGHSEEVVAFALRTWPGARGHTDRWSLRACDTRCGRALPKRSSSCYNRHSNDANTAVARSLTKRGQLKSCACSRCGFNRSGLGTVSF